MLKPEQYPIGSHTTTSNIDTHGIYPEDQISFESMRKAIELIKPVKKMRIEICKKHYKLLQKQLPKIDSIWGGLSGIPVTIRPYLKKIRMYEESTTNDKAAGGK